MHQTAELLTLTEAAEYLNASPRFARRLVDERRVPVYYVGRFVRIRRTDLDDYLTAHLRAARES